MPLRLFRGSSNSAAMVSADSNVAGNTDTAPISVGADTEAKNVQNEDDQPTDLGVTLRRWISGVWGDHVANFRLSNDDKLDRFLKGASDLTDWAGFNCYELLKHFINHRNSVEYCTA